MGKANSTWFNSASANCLTEQIATFQRTLRGQTDARKYRTILNIRSTNPSFIFKNRLKKEDTLLFEMGICRWAWYHQLPTPIQPRIYQHHRSCETEPLIWALPRSEHERRNQDLSIINGTGILQGPCQRDSMKNRVRMNLIPEYRPTNNWITQPVTVKGVAFQRRFRDWEEEGRRMTEARLTKRCHPTWLGCVRWKIFVPGG